MHPAAHSRRVATVALLTLLPAAGQAQSPLIPRPTIAVGYTGGAANPGVLPGSALWQLGAEWTQRGGRPAWRLSLEGWRRNIDLTSTGLRSLGCDARCRLTSREDVVGLSFDGKYELTRGRVRPYLASGIGAYRVATSLLSNYRCDGAALDGPATCAAAADGAMTTFPGGVTYAPGLHAALGASVAVRRMRPFGELRVQSEPRAYSPPPPRLALVFGAVGLP